MSDVTDMGLVIVPRSDQVNADSLLAGPITITITRVEIRPGTEQPVSVFFAGDDGKPFKPCKSMAKVMVHCWGRDASQYVGRSMTLYCDPAVKWGGMEVGGIRISHLSHIISNVTMALTETKGRKKPFVVKPLVIDAPPDKAAVGSQLLVGRIKSAPDQAALEAITADTDVMKQRAYLAKNRPELAALVDDAVASALARFAPEAEGMET